MSKAALILHIMTARIKELETELAELKASIPQIQHDAIVKMQQASNAVVTTNYLRDHDEFAYKYAKNLLTAKGADNAKG